MLHSFIDEIKSAVQSLKNGKAPGMDQVPPEAIKAGGDVLASRLHTLIRLIWQSECIPSAWKKRLWLFLSSKRATVKNAKTIEGSACSPWWAMWLWRSSKTAYKSTGSRRVEKSKLGFVHTVVVATRSSLSVSWQKSGSDVRSDWWSYSSISNQPSTVFTGRLVGQHWKLNVSLKIIRLLLKSYSGSTSCVRIRNETNKEFCIRTGVRQGDAASPILFNIVIDSIMRKAFKDKQGVHYGIYRYATDLEFVDYSAILADTDAEATDTLNDISRITEPFRLKINIDKTKVLTTDGSPANMYLEGIKIEHVQNFKYLGFLVQEKKIAVVAEFQCRIGQVVLLEEGQYHDCDQDASFPDPDYSDSTLWIRDLDPSEEENQQTWGLSNAMQILGVTRLDRILNKTVWRQCGDQYTIQKRHLQYFGHVCWMDSTRLPYKLLWRRQPLTWKVHVFSLFSLVIVVIQVELNEKVKYFGN